MLSQLDDIAISMPEGRPLYDLKEAAPGLVQPSSEALDKLLAYGKDHLDELFAEVGLRDLTSSPGVAYVHFAAWNLEDLFADIGFEV